MNALLLVAILRFAGDEAEYFGKPVFAWRADLDSRDTAVRLRALTVLSEIDKSIPGVFEGLRAGLRDPDPYLRHLAIRTLIENRGVDAPTREFIFKLLDDPDPHVKREALRVKAMPEVRPGGGEVFGVGGLPIVKSIIYVLDGSQSMREIDLAKSALQKAINSLNAVQRVLVLVFRDGKVETLVAGPAPATPQLKQAISAKLDALEYFGTSDPRAALRQALATKFPDGRPAELIYLITDGLLDDAALDEITALNRTGGKPGVRINAIVFGEEDGAGYRTMQRFAEANRGAGKAVDPNRD